MLTREYVGHAYGARKPCHRTSNGTVKIKEINGVVQTWPISRPGAAPEVDDQSPYHHTHSVMARRPDNQLIRGGTASLLLPQNRVEMDPSNSATWQRSYRFTM